MNRWREGHVVRAMTIAGSDSGGGAGIQADLKTFAAFDVYGTSVITALTAQNTLGVHNVHDVDPDFVRAQFEAVISDIGVDAVKTGMLGSTEIVETVADALKAHGVQNLVVDPVMVAKGGQPLIDDTAIQAVIERLLPLAAVITPNIPEAERLCGYPIQDWSSCHQAARDLYAMGAGSVVIKGGHAQAVWADDMQWTSQEAAFAAVDIVFDGSTFTYFSTPRVNSVKTHGTGCTFSAATAAGLARRQSLLDALAAAKAYIFRAIHSAADWDVGAGHGPTDHSVVVPQLPSVVPGRAYEWNGTTFDMRAQA